MFKSICTTLWERKGVASYFYHFPVGTQGDLLHLSKLMSPHLQNRLRSSQWDVGAEWSQLNYIAYTTGPCLAQMRCSIKSSCCFHGLSPLSPLLPGGVWALEPRKDVMPSSLTSPECELRSSHHLSEPGFPHLEKGSSSQNRKAPWIACGYTRPNCCFPLMASLSPSFLFPWHWSVGRFLVCLSAAQTKTSQGK